MINFNDVVDIMLGGTSVEQIADSVGNVLWSAMHPGTMCQVSITSGGNGTVSVNGVVGDYSDTVESGTVLTIEAIGDSAFVFNGWSDGNSNNPRIINVTRDIDLTAGFKAMPFYIEDTSGLNRYVNIRKYTANAPTVTVYYSTDAINWNLLGDTSTTALTTPIPMRGKIYLKSTTSAWGNTSNSSDFNVINTSHLFGENYNIGGNILSLIYGDDFANYNTIPNDSESTFYGLFYGTGVVDASNLRLPSNTTVKCYRSMFQGCARLTTAPALPATTLADSCYYNMFNNCATLTTAPALPATTLATSCYVYMFSGCTTLTTAPALPATTLAGGCYTYMFDRCTRLTTAPALPATTLAGTCYGYMFSGCTSLTTAPALPATTMVQGCYGYMFQGCTALTTAPALPATTLDMTCYQYMFKDCTSLTTAPQILPATSLAANCYQNMFQGCTSLTTAPELPATTLHNFCYNYMFKDCTSLTTAPALPATTLRVGCYQYMFTGCTALNSVTTYATNISPTNCLNNWLNGVSATGTFHNMTCITYPEGASGIPSGWTEIHTTGSTINVTITNTGSYSGATYQIDNGTVEPINETGTTSFTVPTTATSLTVNRNGKGTTDILGVCGISSDTEWTTVIPVNKMSNNVSIDLVSLM